MYLHRGGAPVKDPSQRTAHRVHVSPANGKKTSVLRHQSYPCLYVCEQKIADYNAHPRSITDTLVVRYKDEMSRIIRKHVFGFQPNGCIATKGS